MTLLFTFPEQEKLGQSLLSSGHYEQGLWEWRHFPDSESYVRVLSPVRGKKTAILCSLNLPDAKTLPLLFLAHTLKELDATDVALLAPYLGYMRQDTRFKEGEAVTSEIFSTTLSFAIDALVTIDPHLHRVRRLEDIYACSCTVISAASLVAEWIRNNVKNPLVIGPDIESEQWARRVAQEAKAFYLVLNKQRRGDHDVEITLPDMRPYHAYTPVMVDDVISTAGTMIKAVELLKREGFKEVICVATHGLFAGDAYARLQATGVASIITANTIPHPSNRLDVASLLIPKG